MAEINIQQLKEFFEFRANLQDKRIENVSKKVDTVSTITEALLLKVNMMWKVFGLIGLALLTGVLKALGIV